MRSTILLRLAAPLQSWGVESKFDRRTTEKMPSKSGVIGLAASALGRQRTDSLSDLASLRFGVRVDKRGVLLRDFQTAKSIKSAYVTNRYYLSDAVFLAGLEGDDVFLKEIENALSHPAYPLFLGRRSCPPSGRICLGVWTGITLEQSLEEYPLLCNETFDCNNAEKNNKQKLLHIIIENTDSDKGDYYLRDVPISFDQRYRRFGFRKVTEHTISLCDDSASDKKDITETNHDPMLELED
jgi:CRISPR-associated protein Cas5/CasD, subtype I-E/ECOLI